MGACRYRYRREGKGAVRGGVPEVKQRICAEKIGTPSQSANKRPRVHREPVFG